MIRHSFDFAHALLCFMIVLASHQSDATPKSVTKWSLTIFPRRLCACALSSYWFIVFLSCLLELAPVIALVLVYDDNQLKNALTAKITGK